MSIATCSSGLCRRPDPTGTGVLMRTMLIMALLAAVLCTACGSVTINPIASPSGKVNLADQSITETRNNVAFTVRHDSLSVSNNAASDVVSAFHVTIDNQTDKQVSYPPQVFILKDSDGQQYRTVSPERVREIISKDTVYLIPYPYVGYYYLRDQIVASQTDALSSELPFYAEYHPQDIFARALPEEPILEHSKVSGNIYFLIDLEKTRRADLLLFPDAGTVGDPLAIFSFSVEK